MYQEKENGTVVPPMVQTEAPEVVLPVAPMSLKQRCSPRALRIASLILLTAGKGLLTPTRLIIIQIHSIQNSYSKSEFWTNLKYRIYLLKFLKLSSGTCVLV